ncbi:hypothetical protein BT67DRAFT_475936 [Trichocladium antarcticum]|uniref:CDR ABC transporter domain-containing protein n=1 Tax=Trichocladium antarcticum TaxID=1450529 RepID=A0AAN6ZGK7_9PEZI|nr:hypothetical protein BT67DRAFT_475936 [Trichocladium antarcticum]
MAPAAKPREEDPELYKDQGLLMLGVAVACVAMFALVCYGDVRSRRGAVNRSDGRPEPEPVSDDDDDDDGDDGSAKCKGKGRGTSETSPLLSADSDSTLHGSPSAGSQRSGSTLSWASATLAGDVPPHNPYRGFGTSRGARNPVSHTPSRLVPTRHATMSPETISELESGTPNPARFRLGASRISSNQIRDPQARTTGQSQPSRGIPPYRSWRADSLPDAYFNYHGISDTVHTRVGNDFVRGVSGGERKRVHVLQHGPDHGVVLRPRRHAPHGHPVQRLCRDYRGHDPVCAAGRWINYVNPIAYGYEALMVNEYHARNYTCSSYIPSYGTPGAVNVACDAVGAVAGQMYVNGDVYIGSAYSYHLSNVDGWVKPDQQTQYTHKQQETMGEVLGRHSPSEQA